MGEASKIEWTDHTYNPWWGCARVSPGCECCYAETFAKRTGHAVWGVAAERRFFGEKHWNEPRRWDREAAAAGRRARVFCASMADVFEERPDLIAERRKLWDLVGETPHLDWLLLTKRPANIRKMVPRGWFWDRWPRNVWVGTTVEDQRRADERIPVLLEVPAPVRFLSCEPLLDAVDLTRVRKMEGSELRINALRSPLDTFGQRARQVHREIDWVIVGGESGPGARDFELQWARRIVADCRGSGVPVFVKQLGARPISESDDDRRFVGDMNLPRRFRLILADRKGGDERDWPEDLRVREFPEVAGG